MHTASHKWFRIGAVALVWVAGQVHAAMNIQYYAGYGVYPNGATNTTTVAPGTGLLANNGTGSALVQLVWAGPDGVIGETAVDADRVDPTNTAAGYVEGDDAVLESRIIQNGIAGYDDRLFSFEAPPAFTNTSWSSYGTFAYVRIFQDTIPQDGEAYYDSAPLMIANQPGVTWVHAQIMNYETGSSAVPAAGVTLDRLINAPDIATPLRSGRIVAGDSLRFGSTANTRNSPPDYSWSFGDGRVSAIQNPGLVSFPSAGQFNVTMGIRYGTNGTWLAAGTRNIEVVETNLAPDLAVVDLLPPSDFAIGQITTLTYRVINAGNAALPSQTWTDRLYLSRDQYLDSSDKALVSTGITRSIAASAIYSNTLTFAVPLMDEGSYHLIVSVNDEWQFLEAHRLNNEFAELMNAAIPRLTNGSVLSSQFSGNGAAQVYRIDVPIGAATLRIALDGINNAGISEIYLQRESVPTRGNFDYRSAGTPGSDQQILVSAPAPGTWYIMVYGASVSGSGDFTLRVSAHPVELTAVSPTHHANNLDAQLTVSGAGFLAGSRAILAGGGGSTYTASVNFVDSYSLLTATFGSNTVPQGTYTVRVVRPDGEFAELPGAFQMTGPGEPKLETRVIVPSAVGYHGVATIYVEYSNKGEVSMPAPLLALTAAQNGQQRAFLTLKQHRLVEGFWTSAEPEGFAHSVQFLASGNVPGTLQPGETMRMPVYYAGWQQPWDFSYPPISWNLAVIKADDPASNDWSQMKADMRPATINTEAWELLWSNLVSNVGTTWGSYVTMLNENASYLGRLGLRVLDIGELLSFELLQAEGLNPVGATASGVDASVSAPGIPLVFTRSSASSISRRYETGPFGRGWSHNWQYSLAVAPDGKVTITGPGGSRRIFQPDSRNSNYFPAPGDEGILRSLGSGRFSLQEANGFLTAFRSDGLLDYVQDLNSNRITAGYINGRLSSLGHSSGRSIQISYNGADLVHSVTDDLQRQTIYSYDANWEHLIQVQHDDDSVTYYTYGTGAAAHALTNISGSCCSERTFVYDAMGRLSRMWAGQDESVVDFEYGTAGSMAQRDALGNASRSYFDHRGLMVKSENALGHAVHIDYDVNYNPVKVTDPAGRTSHYKYDSHGNLIASTDPLGGVTRFSFAGPWNRMSEVSDTKGNLTRFSYTAAANLTDITHADNTVERWSYDARGLPSVRTNRRGQAIGYLFNIDGRLIWKTYPGGTNAVFEYDARGNMVAASNEAGRSTFTYDTKDRLVRIDYPWGPWLQLTYDDSGRRATSLDQLGHRLSYHYDSAGRMESVTDENTNLVAMYVYNDAGRITRKTLGNGMFTDYEYDPAGRVTNLVNKLANHAVISRFAYTYDSRGRRTSMDTLDGKWSYEHDDLGQLTNAVFLSTTNDIPGQDLTYIYDAAGNRIRTIENGVTNDYSANNMNQYTRTVSSDGRTNSYTFDADGNLVSEIMTGAGQPAATNYYTFNAENRLVSVSASNDTRRFVIDPLGNQAGTVVNGVTNRSVIDPSGFGNLVGEYDNAGNLIARYDYMGGLVSRSLATGNPFYYAYDVLGNAHQLVASIGGVSNSYAYRPYGVLLRRVSAIPDPFQFNGEHGVLSSINQQSVMRARLYNPDIGRFVSEDPSRLLETSFNLYAFVRNNPSASVDPSGLETWSVDIGLPIGVAWGSDSLTGEQAFCLTGGLGAGILHDPNNTPSSGLNFGLRGSLGNFGGEAIIPMITENGSVHPSDKIDGIYNKIEGVGFSLGFTACYSWGRRDPSLFVCTLVAPEPDGFITNGASVASGSTDPNQKTGPAGFGPNGHIGTGDAFAYRIDFENFTNASAPAQQVIITDQLSSHLNWAMLELTEVGFGDQLIKIPANSQYFETAIPMTYNGVTFDVQIEAGVNLGNGQLYAAFRSVDPSNGLPPAVNIGFLPPEDGTGRGMGHVAYTLLPKTNLAHGTEIRNIAFISFDNQPAIRTDQVDPQDSAQGIDTNKQCLNTIDKAPPASVASVPAPVILGTQLPVSWSGSDDGAGIATYDVYAREDNGPWTLWLENTANVSGNYTGTPGRTFAFRTVARDHAGNVEPSTTNADAVVFLGINTPPTITSLADSPDPVDRGATILLTASGVMDTDGGITKVEFYHDANSNGAWSTNDTLVATVTGVVSGVASTLVNSASFPAGTSCFFAVAYDNASPPARSEAAKSCSTIVQKWALTYQLTPEGVGNTVIESPAAGSHPDGTVINPSATPGAGYIFDHWEVNGQMSTMPFLLGTATTVRAVFVPNITRIIGVSGNLAYGNVTTGQIATGTLIITNSGNASLTIANIGYPPGFSGVWAGQVDAGQATSVVVTFAPTNAQSYGGMITVNSDATAGNDTISCSGTGIASSATNNKAVDIVFHSNRHGGYDIWGMNSGGGGLVLLAGEAGDQTEPIWSPDGRHILYRSHHSGLQALWIMNADGTDKTIILTTSDAATAPKAWLSDASHVVYVRDPSYSTCNDYAYIIGTNGAGEQLWLNPAFVDDVSVSGISISADGSRVVWASEDGCALPSLELYVAPLANQVIQTSAVIRLTNNGQYEDGASFSPDSQKIAFSRSEAAAGYGAPENIFVISVSGSNLTNLTQGTGTQRNSQPSWSPDGQRIIYASNTDGSDDLWIMNADGSGKSNLTASAAIDESGPQWRHVAPQSLMLEAYLSCADGLIHSNINLQSIANPVYRSGQQVVWRITPSHFSYAYPYVDELRFYAQFDGSNLHVMVHGDPASALRAALPTLRFDTNEAVNGFALSANHPDPYHYFHPYSSTKTLLYGILQDELAYLKSHGHLSPDAALAGNPVYSKAGATPIHVFSYAVAAGEYDHSWNTFHNWPWGTGTDEAKYYPGVFKAEYTDGTVTSAFSFSYSATSNYALYGHVYCDNSEQSSILVNKSVYLSQVNWGGKTAFLTGNSSPTNIDLRVKKLWSTAGAVIWMAVEADSAIVSGHKYASGPTVVNQTEVPDVAQPLDIVATVHGWNLEGLSKDGDIDGDGMLDIDEIYVGTNPNDENSLFRMITPSNTSGKFVVQWYSEDGIKYRVMHSTNLKHGFLAVRTNIPATPPVNSSTNTLSGGLGIFSVEAE